MEFKGVEIVCPACRQDLRRSGDVLHCTSCSRTYPVLHDIPDLRLWPDPYIGIEDDRAKGLRLAQECASLGFEESVRLYYRQTTVVPDFQANAFTRGLLAAADRAADSLAAWESIAGRPTAGLRLLEIGCGTAPLLAGASSRYERVAGIDVAFRWLILAQKRLEEAGLDVPLLCACAEALPFADSSFDIVVADSAIEVLRDQRRGGEQAYRILEPGGWFFAATPNRFSLGPDPHVGLWAGGWLPQSFVASWVRRRGGIPPHRRLLSRRGVRRLLESTGFTDIRVRVPVIPAAQRDGFTGSLRTIIDAYNAAARNAAGSAVLSAIGPLLHVSARRPASARPLGAGGPARASDGDGADR
jgi:SAM-dependent methyltransferase